MQEIFLCMINLLFQCFNVSLALTVTSSAYKTSSSISLCYQWKQK